MVCQTLSGTHLTSVLLARELAHLSPFPGKGRKAWAVVGGGADTVVEMIQAHIDGKC